MWFNKDKTLEGVWRGGRDIGFPSEKLQVLLQPRTLPYPGEQIQHRLGFLKQQDKKVSHLSVTHNAVQCEKREEIGCANVENVGACKL